MPAPIVIATLTVVICYGLYFLTLIVPSLPLSFLLALEVLPRLVLMAGIGAIGSGFLLLLFESVHGSRGFASTGVVCGMVGFLLVTGWVFYALFSYFTTGYLFAPSAIPVLVTPSPSDR